ncbi:MAG: hypothetical protein Q9165_007702 [Trypethelium subeluteriae]
MHPTPAESSFRKHAWMKFHRKARDTRVNNPAVQEEFSKAQKTLDGIVPVRTDEKIEANAERWNQHRQDFQAKSERLLTACNGHVWQAIDASFKTKDQCGRCRCYFSGVEVICPNDGTKPVLDTKTAQGAGGIEERQTVNNFRVLPNLG